MATRRIGDLITIAAAMTRIDRADIIGPRRNRMFSSVRFAIYHVAHNWGLHSSGQIGAAVGGRDHTTILHGLDRARYMIERDAGFASLVDRLKAACLEVEPFACIRPFPLADADEQVRAA